jgi:hypothetical protein
LRSGAPQTGRPSVRCPSREYLASLLPPPTPPVSLLEATLLSLVSQWERLPVPGSQHLCPSLLTSRSGPTHPPEGYCRVYSPGTLAELVQVPKLGRELTESEGNTGTVTEARPPPSAHLATPKRSRSLLYWGLEARTQVATLSPIAIQEEGIPHFHAKITGT